jgi:hypothetical protein
MFVENKVNRSHKLKCCQCKTNLPMGTSVVFELDEDYRFVAVYCLGCVNSDPYLFLSTLNEHPYNLED